MGPAVLNISAGMLSFPGDFPELFDLIAFWISSRVGGVSRSSIGGCCVIWCSTSLSTVDGLFRRELKCSVQRLRSPSWSLIRVLPSDNCTKLQTIYCVFLFMHLTILNIRLAANWDYLCKNTATIQCYFACVRIESRYSISRQIRIVSTSLYFVN